MYNKSNNAFTLVELSIVLIIIGIIIGGIIGAQSLLELSKLNTTLKDVTRFKAALSTFELQYDALPGDFSEAQNYWGVNVSDGDNNRRVDTDDEKMAVWEHLVKAKIIEGSYTGTIASGSNYVAGINMPKMPIYGTIIGLSYATAGGNSSATNNLWISAYKAEDANFFDMKIDDGIAYTGRLRGYSVGGGVDGLNCIKTAVPYNEYNLPTATAENCITQLLYD